MTSDLGRKSRWANEAIGPAQSVLGRAGRGLVDLPADVTPGARQVAQLTAWRAAQDHALTMVTAALDELRVLPDWSGGFLVVDQINFDWRDAPFRHYTSFDDFYRRELQPTYQAWERLLARWNEVSK